MKTLNFVSFIFLFIVVTVYDGHAHDISTEGIKKIDTSLARVLSVSVVGSENDYTFSVKIASPDKGCSAYANWWEVIDTKGNLLYRRILAHSHTNEQPFIRSGGPVKITKSTEVYVRAHMNKSGYGNGIFFGSVEKGFQMTYLPAKFASNLAKSSPLAQSCAF